MDPKTLRKMYFNMGNYVSVAFWAVFKRAIGKIVAENEGFSISDSVPSLKSPFPVILKSYQFEVCYGLISLRHHKNVNE